MRKQNVIIKELISTAFCVLIALAASLLIVNFIGIRTEVFGPSMNDTLAEGENIILDKISYRLGAPERFDIVVFPPAQGAAENYIKRIIGLPGETVFIDQRGQIYIDDVLLEESYGRETIQDPGLAAAPVRLGTDEYFVLGDNRNYSLDSRDPAVGNVSRSQIIGKAWIRIWPLSKFGSIRHQ